MNTQKIIEFLEKEGYIVLTKLDIRKIIDNLRLGKKPTLNKNGKIVGWTD